MEKTYTVPEKPGHNATCIADDDIQYIENVLCAILDDALNLLPFYGSTDCARDKNRIKNRLHHEGTSFATKTLPKFMNDVLIVLEGGLPSFEGFRKLPSSRLPVFLNGLLDMVWSHGLQDSDALNIVYTLCVAFKKLKGDYPKSVLSNELDKFIKTDESLLSCNFLTTEKRPIVLRAKKYIETIFRDVNLDEAKPHPGPGAVNTPLKHYMRYEPHVRYEQLDSVFPYRNWFYTNAWGFKESVRKYFALKERDYPTSRMKYVHKYLDKPRGICIEENETQYLQQGVKAVLYKTIEQHPMTKGRVNFKSQQINRDLALQASSDRLSATVDMSEASNRIARDLVALHFRDTAIFEQLDALSTRIITFPKEVRKGQLLTQMFAPMGSAVCFPIMAIIHFALCKAIISLSGVENAKEASKHVYVYGDDIIVPSEFTELIFTKLPWFGMKLNKEKSFFKSYFRESCGIHAYKGVDITPVYNNYTLNSQHERKDTTRLLSCLAKEYAYYKKGMYTTAAVVRTHICKIYGQLPFGKPTSRLLCFKRDAHSLLVQRESAKKWRYNTDMQKREFLFRIVVSRFSGQLSLLGSAALLCWYNTSKEESASFMDFESQKIVSRWVSESDLG